MGQQTAVQHQQKANRPLVVPASKVEKGRETAVSRPLSLQVEEVVLQQHPLVQAGVRLQRTIGNRAIGHLLNSSTAPTVQRKLPDWGTAVAPTQSAAPLRDTFFRSSDQVVQRVKSEKERGDKHQRVQMAQKAIPLLQSKVDGKLKDHLFDAKPITGEIKKDKPTGLHAYKNGGLPKGIEVVETQGSTGKVHGIKWRWQGSTSEKKSTMFPDWMPAEHVNALLALNESSVVGEMAEKGISATAVRTYIQHGQKITIKGSGDTTYPSRPDLDSWIKG